MQQGFLLKKEELFKIQELVEVVNNARESKNSCKMEASLSCGKITIYHMQNDVVRLDIKVKDGGK